MPRILTPATHSEETLQIAYDLLSPGWELVMAPHGRPEFYDLLRDTEYYIGGGQFRHGPDFYERAPKLKIMPLPNSRVAAATVAPPPGSNTSSEPTAEHSTGMRNFLPKSVRLLSTFDTSRKTRGRKPQESRARRLRAKVVSVSEPPIR